MTGASAAASGNKNYSAYQQNLLLPTGTTGPIGNSTSKANSGAGNKAYAYLQKKGNASSGIMSPTSANNPNIVLPKNVISIQNN